MNYYKSTELAEKYGVSRRTITNWIEQTRQGRLHLELYEKNDRFFVSKTPKNQLIMKGLVPERRKFLNKRSLKHATPVPEFYDIYSQSQILDIISNIETNREIPRQYNYFNSGADFWDHYAKRLYEDDIPNMLNSTIKLLDDDRSFIDSILSKYDYVNIVDLGMGNVLPTKALLSRVLESGKLKRYVAIDISKKMLDIAERNVLTWFGNKVNFESHCLDFSFERFGDILAEPTDDNGGKTINLVLLLGATLANFRDPEDVLKTVRKSMRHEDLFVYTTGLDSPGSRWQFNFSVDDSKGQPLPPQYKFILDFLGIDETHYSAELGFNEKVPERYLRIRLKHALTINFELERGDWRVDLNKGDTLIVWRARHDTAFDIADHFYDNGFSPLLTSQTPDHDYMLLLADLRKDGR